MKYLNYLFLKNKPKFFLLNIVFIFKKKQSYNYNNGLELSMGFMKMT